MGFKQKFATLKNNTNFIEYEQTETFADFLLEMLEELQQEATTPCIGLDMVAHFFDTDKYVFEVCKDSYGTLANIYLNEAKELFFHYASLCQDTWKISGLFIKLIRDDNYGACSSLMKKVPVMLKKSVFDTILGSLKCLEKSESDEKKQKIYSWMLTSLKSQQEEERLFQKALQGRDVELSGNRIVEAATILLKEGNVDGAHSLIMKFPEKEMFGTYEKDKLLKEIYAKQGNTENLTALLYKKFRSNRTLDSLHELLGVIGKEKRDEVLRDEILLIHQNPIFDVDDALFLADVQLVDKLEEYVFLRAKTIDGGDYYILPKLAQALSASKRYLASTIIYRCLLESMMKRAYAKSYHHGVDYLTMLDSFAPLIKDWKTYTPHPIFKATLLAENKRKVSFWNQYVQR